MDDHLGCGPRRGAIPMTFGPAIWARSVLLGAVAGGYGVIVGAGGGFVIAPLLLLLLHLRPAVAAGTSLTIVFLNARLRDDRLRPAATGSTSARGCSWRCRPRRGVRRRNPDARRVTRDLPRAVRRAARGAGGISRRAPRAPAPAAGRGRGRGAARRPSAAVECHPDGPRPGSWRDQRVLRDRRRMADRADAGLIRTACPRTSRRRPRSFHSPSIRWPVCSSLRVREPCSGRSSRRRRPGPSSRPRSARTCRGRSAGADSSVCSRCCSRPSASGC